MRTRSRHLRLALVLSTVRVCLRALSLLVPTTRSVVVAGFPETEGNAVETARALLRHYPGRVVWLREASEPPQEVRELAALGARLVPKASPAGLWAYLRAEAVFFTHGLYGSPVPSARRPVVNLWHGDGPKDIRPRVRSEHVASTYVVGSTTLFTHLTKCEAFDVPTERAIVTGNPRTDQLWRTPPPERLRALGIQEPFVLWMPTWRRARQVGAVIPSVSDTDTTADEAAIERLLGLVGERGVQLVVKPHPLDVEGRRDPRWITITEEGLSRAEVTLYQLLGASSGLVTDYSSVWADYLLLDRPMAFLVTDRHTFSRPLVPADVLDWLPGELVEGGEDGFRQYVADLDAAGALGAAQRKEVASRIGLHQSRHAADGLLDALHDRGVLRLR